MKSVSFQMCGPTIKEVKDPALAHVAQCIEGWPVNRKVAGSIPSQGTCLGCRPGPQGGEHMRGNHTLMFLPSLFPSLFLSLKNK